MGRAHLEGKSSELHKVKPNLAGAADEPAQNWRGNDAPSERDLLRISFAIFPTYGMSPETSTSGLRCPDIYTRVVHFCNRMEIIDTITEFEILSVLARRNEPLTSGEIAEELDKIGTNLSRRRVRQYLELLDGKGFTENLHKQGRRITEAGKEELEKAFVHTKVDYILHRNAVLCSSMNFDIKRKEGTVVVNLSVIDKNKEQRALKILEDICTKTNWAQPFIKIAYAGDALCNYKIPDGKIGLATVSSMSIDGIISNNGIYVVPLYGGLVEFSDLRPIRFTTMAPTKGCPFDPITIFMEKDRSSVCEAIRKGHGFVPGDYREYPIMERGAVIKLLEKITEILGGLIVVGKPRELVLGVLPSMNYGGIAGFGGELLISALEENKISTHSRPADTLMNLKELQQISDLKGEVLLV